MEWAVAPDHCLTETDTVWVIFNSPHRVSDRSLPFLLSHYTLHFNNSTCRGLDMRPAMTAGSWSSKDSLRLISKGCNYHEVFCSAGMRILADLFLVDVYCEKTSAQATLLLWRLTSHYLHVLSDSE